MSFLTMCVPRIFFLLPPAARALTWFGISDVHFGHDVLTKNGTVTTSLSLNIQAVAELNALANNASWPASLGGGVVQTPRGVVLSGDIVDNGFTQACVWGEATANRERALQPQPSQQVRARKFHARVRAQWQRRAS